MKNLVTEIGKIKKALQVKIYSKKNINILFKFKQRSEISIQNL